MQAGVALASLPISGNPYLSSGNENILPHSSFISGSCLHLHCALCTAVLGSWHRLLKPVIWIAFMDWGWIKLPETDSAQVLVLLNVEAQLLPVYRWTEINNLFMYWQDTITDERINTFAIFVKFFSSGTKILLFFMYAQSMECSWWNICHCANFFYPCRFSLSSVCCCSREILPFPFHTATCSCV